MFWHVFINQFKILIRKKALIFWVLIFPIILSTFFYLAFSNLTSNEKFKPFSLAIVEDKVFIEEENFESVVKNLSKGKDKLFNVEFVKEEKAKELLINNKISLYLDYDEEIKIITNNNGFNQVIMKNIIDEYYQSSRLITTIITNRYEINVDKLVEDLKKQSNYLIIKENLNLDYTVMYFYPLIAMVIMFGAYFVLNVINSLEANLSKSGARLSVCGVSKFKIILASLSSTFIVQCLSLIIFLFYINLILKIDLGTNIAVLSIISLIGIIFSSLIALLIATAFKFELEKKEGIITFITLFLSFLAGMMSVDIKYIIDQNLPFLSIINPVNLITDSLYALYYYQNFNQIIINMVYLSIISFVIFIFVLKFIRRKTYDSI